MQYGPFFDTTFASHHAGGSLLRSSAYETSTSMPCERRGRAAVGRRAARAGARRRAGAARRRRARRPLRTSAKCALAAGGGDSRTTPQSNHLGLPAGEPSDVSNCTCTLFLSMSRR